MRTSRRSVRPTTPVADATARFVEGVVEELRRRLEE
jgi:hypothetical protein